VSSCILQAFVAQLLLKERRHLAHSILLLANSRSMSTCTPCTRTGLQLRIRPERFQKYGKKESSSFDSISSSNLRQNKKKPMVVFPGPETSSLVHYVRLRRPSRLRLLRCGFETAERPTHNNSDKLQDLKHVSTARKQSKATLIRGWIRGVAVFEARIPVDFVLGVCRESTRASIPSLSFHWTPHAVSWKKELLRIMLHY
jgi:hypothetical protein